MFYQPQTITKMWDTWLFEHEDVFFLFYLVTEHSPGEGICLATSDDGVNWKEHGLIFPKSEESVWLGTGSVWKSERYAEDGLFILNFSEWFGPEDTGQQKIFFATSSDLVHWTRCDGEFDFGPDALYYRYDEGNNSRWDCIYSFPRPGGGRIGYWTANPRDFQPGFGFGESLDGVHWQALAPPHIDWGTRQVPPCMEAGAVELIVGNYYMMAGIYLPYEGKIGMITLVANSPAGPFSPAHQNLFLLGSHRWTAYFSRFFPTSQGMLVNHHVITRHDERAFAPLKRAIVDDWGTLRLHWWGGNEAVKGKQLPCPTQFDAKNGAVLEGQIHLPAPAVQNGILLSLETQNDLDSAPIENQFALFLNASGTVASGILDTQTTRFESEEQIDREVGYSGTIELRLLLRGEWIEWYLNDILMGCHNLPTPMTGQVAFVSLSEHGELSALEPIALSAWAMEFKGTGRI